MNASTNRLSAVTKIALSPATIVSFNSSIITTTNTTTMSLRNETNKFSLLQDDDGEEELNPPTIKESTCKSDSTKGIVRSDSSTDTNDVMTTTDFYDTVVRQATKWIVELEQIRDMTIWYHVENSFHRDNFIMMNIETTRTHTDSRSTSTNYSYQ